MNSRQRNQVIFQIMREFISRCLAASFSLWFAQAALFPQPAEAYLDPGTGSLLFQYLLAAILAPIIAFRGVREWIKRFFVRRR